MADPSSHPVPEHPTEWSWWVGEDGLTLYVGITRTDPEARTFEPLMVAAVVPPLAPLPHMPRGADQAELFAEAIRDALAAGDWTSPDGLHSWLIDKGYPHFAWPDGSTPTRPVDHEAMWRELRELFTASLLIAQTSDLDNDAERFASLLAVVDAIEARHTPDGTLNNGEGSDA